MDMTVRGGTMRMYRLARRHRLELILLGMVLSRDGDRDYILDRIHEEMDIESEVVSKMITAVRSGGGPDVKEALKLMEQRWGIEVDGRFVDYVLERLTGEL